MEFTLWLGPIPIRWAAEFTEVNQQGFIDVQVRGPFERWVHQHRFHPVSAEITEIEDTIDFKIGWSLKAPVALAMAIGLPGLFAYRAWRTRQQLEGKSHLAGGNGYSQP